MDVTSFLLGFQKGKALGGGGNAADVRYVTFMNGLKIEYVKPVATGDDCVDVLTKGLISTPTKDPTVDTVYTYSGWSLTDGGNADANALKAVTENRTVYAAYTSAVRTYTITYYDSDGVTVLKTESLAYGATPSYTPAKDGLNFDGWVPALATVTGDASYTAQFSEKLTFAGASWADIAAISEAGEAADYFELGDIRNETLVYDGVTYTVKLVIAGFNHDDLSDGSGKAGMTIVCSTAITATRTDISGTRLKTIYPSEVAPIFNGLPESLRNCAKSVKKTRNYITTRGNETGKPVYSLITDSTRYFYLSPVEAGVGSYTTTSSLDPDGVGECYELYTTSYFGDKKKESHAVNTETGDTRDASIPTRIVGVWQGWMIAVNPSSNSTTSIYYKSIFGFCI